MDIAQNQDYFNWIFELKSTIKKRQIKAAIAVNSNLILMYWDLGKQIVEKQENAKWGSGFIDQLSKDLKSEFPDIGGFSRSNLFAIKKFYHFYSEHFLIVQQVAGQLENDYNDGKRISESFKAELVQQVAGQNSYPSIIEKCCQIPWFHNIILIEKVKNFKEIEFYINQTINKNWSRSVLEYKIETNLFKRQGSSDNNLANTLPEIQSNYTNKPLKDSYNIEFLNLLSII